MVLKPGEEYPLGDIIAMYMSDRLHDVIVAVQETLNNTGVVLVAEEIEQEIDNVEDLINTIFSRKEENESE